MKNNLPDDYESLPKFQQMQYLFSAHIRDPDHIAYNASEIIKGAEPVESRRLRAYEELFFNNLLSFFSGLFPVLNSVLGEERWTQIIREYMQKHKARTPLFHELGQEFLLFLQNEYEPIEQDPQFLYELAHYEWVELALTVEISEKKKMLGGVGADTCIRLSKTAMPLSYEWQVNEISNDFVPDRKPDVPSYFLVFRTEEFQIEFVEISAGLFLLLTALVDNQSLSVYEIVNELAEQTGQNVELLQSFALDVLNKLVDKGVFVTLTAEETI